MQRQVNTHVHTHILTYTQWTEIDIQSITNVHQYSYAQTSRLTATATAIQQYLTYNLVRDGMLSKTPAGSEDS